MGALPKNNRIYEIQHLQERHKEILRRLTLGESHKSIAQELGITRAVVTYTQNSELGREKLDELQGGRDETVKNITGHIAELQPKAMEILEDALNGKVTQVEGANITANTQIKVAQDLLGRGGHVAPSRILGKHEHEHKLTASDIEKIKALAYERGQENGQIANAEIIEAEILEPARMEDGNAEGSDT